MLVDPLVIAALLALAASVCWGTGDVIAGLAGRRTSSWTVSFVSQITSLVLGLTLLAVLGHEWMGWRATWPALAAGVAVGLGMGAYFKALAVGTMSLVAPIAASGAIVPVVVGLIRGEQPSLIQAVGVVAAVVGVALAVYDRQPQAGVVGTIEVGAAAENLEPAAGAAAGSSSAGAPGRAASAAPALRPRLAAGLAVASAACFGSSLVGYAATAAYDPYLPPIAGRVTSVMTLVVLVWVFRARALRAAGYVSARGADPSAAGVTGAAPVVAGRPSPDHTIPGFWLPRDILPRVVVAGLFHLAAATFFSLSSTRGLLSLVSVLSSFGAVVTMGLAYYIIRERLEPQQMVGVVLALVGVVAIAGG